eukprot:4281486-Lingulodinium_polyedra.AAC.1
MAPRQAPTEEGSEEEPLRNPEEAWKRPREGSQEAPRKRVGKLREGLRSGDLHEVRAPAGAVV